MTSWLSRNARLLVAALAVMCCLLGVVAVVLIGPNLVAGLPVLFRTPTVPPPTPPCVEPRLQLGAVTFPIEVMSRPANGTLLPKSAKTDTVYWLDGTTAPYLFALYASPATAALRTSLVAGDAAMILWGDCSSDEYEVSAVTISLPDNLDQFKGSGLAVLVQTGQAGEGFTILGARPQAVPTTPEATDAANPTLQADIAFLHTTSSADGSTVSVGISIHNISDAALTLAPGDIALVLENGEELLPLSADPALPLEIAPDVDQPLELSFPHPATGTIVLRLRTFTAELYLDSP